MSFNTDNSKALRNKKTIKKKKESSLHRSKRKMRALCTFRLGLYLPHSLSLLLPSPYVLFLNYVVTRGPIYNHHPMAYTKIYISQSFFLLYLVLITFFLIIPFIIFALLFSLLSTY